MRAQAGKESDVLLYGRLQSRAKVQKEIARNVTFTSTLENMEGVATPEEVSVFTPHADSSVPSSQVVYTDNLPSMKFKQEIQSFSTFLVYLIGPGCQRRYIWIRSDCDQYVTGSVAESPSSTMRMQLFFLSK